MKYYLVANNLVQLFNHLWLVLLAIACLFLFTSCDKVNVLVDRLKDVGGQSDAYAKVDKVDHEQAKILIAEESKLVMVEFYTDT
ncbi:MAG: hypothetical protein ACPIA7_07815 [Akkermansiaceae bacterium]